LPQKATERATYMADCLTAFADTNLVFFDPDNGLEVAKTRLGWKTGMKYVFLDEISAAYGAGKSVLVYQHFGMAKPWPVQIVEASAKLRRAAPGGEIWAYRTTTVVFLLALHPGTPTLLRETAEHAATQWQPAFIRGERVEEQEPSDGSPEPEATFLPDPTPAGSHDESAEASSPSPSHPRPSFLRRLLGRIR
jgi:hypothetical protein